MNIDHVKFVIAYEELFKPLSASQHEALDELLTFFEKDKDITDPGWIAYMLATVKHETDDTYRPIEEYGKGKGRKYGIPAKNGKVYYGRGYVQLTWHGNYLVMTDYVGVDLVSHPEEALSPDTAYKILSVGMRKGMFTGKKLADYIKGDERDYQNARRIINGVDCAEKIAGYAVKFEKILERST